MACRAIGRLMPSRSGSAGLYVVGFDLLDRHGVPLYALPMAIAPSAAEAASTDRGAAFLHALRAALPDLRLLTDAARDRGIPLGRDGVHAPGHARWAWRSRRRPPRWRRSCGWRPQHGCRSCRAAPASGLSGGATAVEGALTVVMTGMRAILEIDQANLLAVVQPGVINADLGRAVAEHGLFYPPDPASFEICSIGGNLAENSGGLRCVKYGVTRDYVLGLEVVLADGSVIRTGGRTVKDVMGYDLTQLLRRLGGDARHHHRGDPAAAAGAPRRS